MKTDASSVSINYGDAEISFFNIKLDFPVQSDVVWHRHNYYEIHVCRQAHIDYTFEDKNLTLHEGELLIIPPHVPHVSVTKENQAFASLYVISMDISMVRGDKNFFDTLVCALSQASLRPLCIKRACRLDLEIFSANSSYHTIKGVCRLKAVGAEFLSLLFNSIVSDDRDIYSKRETTILIDNMINLPNITLEDIAKATNYSKRHVCRIIKEKYGSSLGKIKKQALIEDVSNEK